MQPRQLWTAVLIAGLAVCALAAAASTSWASAPRQYVLHHPKREHCRRHYRRKVVTVKRRVHGHTKRVRETVCIRVHPIPPKPAPSVAGVPPTYPVPVPVPSPTVTPLPTGRERRPQEPTRRPGPKPAGPTCTTIFTGAENNIWGSPTNWTAGVPTGASSYACIPADYPTSVVFSMNPTDLAEVGGLSAEDPDGIAFDNGRLLLANPAQPSEIMNLKPGAAGFSLADGVTLALTGKEGALGGQEWRGPGTLEIPRGALLRTGACARWGGEKETRCVEGTPTPGRAGLQVNNDGLIVGAGIALCTDGASHPAKLENEGAIVISLTGGFGGASECGESGSVVNGSKGNILLANLDGNGCNVQVRVPSLINSGQVKLGSCTTPETAEVHRPTLDVGNSLTEAGTIIDGGIVQIDGDYTPDSGSVLTIGIKKTFPEGSPETNYGTVRVAGSAILAGELNIRTSQYLNFAPPLGQTYDILDAGGSLSGQFTLGEHCIPTAPGDGYRVIYNAGGKSRVTLEVVKLSEC